MAAGLLAALFLFCSGVGLPRVRSLGDVFALSGFPIIVVGSGLLALFGSELHRWRKLSLWLSNIIETVHRSAGIANWPTPFMLGQIPSNPLSLVLDKDDLRVLRSGDLPAWSQHTAALVRGEWPFDAQGTGARFENWQTQLVAEMKVAAVALRTCGWCAVLAPALVLALAQVYPPAFERIQIFAAVALLTLSFAAIVYAAVVLEQDCLLGPMFTRDKDRLSLGGIVALIWPKLLVFTLLLLAVFLPDVWDWFRAAAKSLNALQ
jgi:hypothetical protein